METKEIKDTLFTVVMFIPTMIFAFFVFMAAKLSGRKDWGMQ